MKQKIIIENDSFKLFVSQVGIPVGLARIFTLFTVSLYKQGQELQLGFTKSSNQSNHVTWVEKKSPDVRYFSSEQHAMEFINSAAFQALRERLDA